VFVSAAALSRPLLIQPSRSAGQCARQLAGIRPARRSTGAPQKSWRVNQTLLDETSQRRRRKNQRTNQTLSAKCRPADTRTNRQLPEK
jgi:hypothetical protein